MISAKKINILHLVNGFAIGGAELKLLELVKQIHMKFSDQYNQVICSVGQGGPLELKFKQIGLLTYVFEKRHKFDLSLVFKVAEIMKENNIDIVQTTLFYADVIGAIAARYARVPVLISWETVSHSNNYMHDKFYRKLAYQFAMKYFTKIVAVSNEVKKSLIDLRRITDEKIQVIHYGVDVDQFKYDNENNIRKEIGINNQDFPVIGVIGRLDPVKGHTYLLDALGNLKNRYPMLKCLIIGDGEFRIDLQKKSNSLGLTKNVFFLGFRNDVNKILNSLDIFVLPSLSEGLPNVILEAMSSSVPVVATNVGGIPEVISDRITGMLVSPQDSEALSNSIIKLLDNNDIRNNIITRGKELINEKFSLNNQVKQFHELYQNSNN